MKLNFEVEVPKACIETFVKSGIKEEDVALFLEQMITRIIESLLESLPETMVGLKSGAINFADCVDTWVKTGVEEGEAADKRRNELC